MGEGLCTGEEKGSKSQDHGSNGSQGAKKRKREAAEPAGEPGETTAQMETEECAGEIEQLRWNPLLCLC